MRIEDFLKTNNGAYFTFQAVESFYIAQNMQERCGERFFLFVHGIINDGLVRGIIKPCKNIHRKTWLQGTKHAF